MPISDKTREAELGRIQLILAEDQLSDMRERLAQREADFHVVQAEKVRVTRLFLEAQTKTRQVIW